jgi:hypothetical protein
MIDPMTKCKTCQTIMIEEVIKNKKGRPKMIRWCPQSGCPLCNVSFTSRQISSQRSYLKRCEPVND